MGSLVGNRLAAQWTALMSKDRSSGLKAFVSELESLSRQLGDARALTWSTDFSDALGARRARSRRCCRARRRDPWRGDLSASLETRLPMRAARTRMRARTDGLVGELAKGLEGDWPYLAF